MTVRTWAGAASPIPWLMPAATVANLNALGAIGGITWTPINRNYTGVWLTGWSAGLPVAGQVLQYCNLEHMRADAAAGHLPANTWVMYDLEVANSPADQLTNFARSMRQFTNIAHEYGLKAALCPTGIGLRYGRTPTTAVLRTATKAHADCYIAQVQSVTDTAHLLRILRSLSTVWDMPNESLVVELSLGQATAAQMLAQWTAAKAYCAGFCIWGAGGDAAKAAIVHDFLTSVAAA